MEGLIPAIATVVVALIELLAARDRKKNKAYADDLLKREQKRRQEDEEREEFREKTTCVNLKLVYAIAKLSQAMAIAIKTGHANGEVSAAQECLSKAEEEYQCVCQEALVRAGVKS